MRGSQLRLAQQTMRSRDARGHLASAPALEGVASRTPDPALPPSQHTPVYPICQSTSACRVWATWRGMALSSRRLECLPVACQNPEPRERLALRRGRDDCHFWLHRVSLQGTMGSARAKKGKILKWHDACQGKQSFYTGLITVWNPVSSSPFARRVFSMQLYL